jgi:hypothetical protein
MTECKVELIDRAGKVLHTYPITLTVTNPTPRDADYEMAALSAAKMAKLVPDADTSSLKTRMHTAAHAAA